MRRLKTMLAGFAALTLAASAVSASAQNVNARQASQERRIEQGQRSGQLTPGETNRIENERATTQSMEARMRAEHGGRLTGNERSHLNRRLDRQNRMIKKFRHNGRSYHHQTCSYRHHMRHCRYW